MHTPVHRPAPQPPLLWPQLSLPRAAFVALCAMLLAVLTTAMLPAPSRAQAQGPEAARVIMASGAVERLPRDAREWQAVLSGAVVGMGDTLRTGADGRAALLLRDESIVRLTHDTVFLLQQVAPGPGDAPLRHTAAGSLATEAKRSLLRVLQGELWLLNKNPEERVDVQTRAMTASLRGTEFDLRVEEDGTSLVSMLEGTVEVWNEQGRVTLHANESAMTRPGFAPVKRMLLTPENAVQWTVLVPQLLHYERLFQSRATEPAVQRLRQAWDAVDQGELQLSRDLLTTLTTEFPDFAPAWESLALTSLAVNDSEAALRAVTEAERLAPSTPYPLMLRSLIDQARFDLPRAEEAIRAALALAADNVLAHVQLATLLFGRGATAEARQVLEQAIRLAPENAEVNTLHGFILLALRQHEAAVRAFTQATNAAPALAEPHLGLGLIAMRQGEEARAMTEITSAVLLEPRRALLRSYWAKMLYQLGRHQKALDVLAVSQHLDPRDPTPDLYRALIHRDLRQPGAAIAALNQAIRKNGMRAVYRSRLLLDQDLAVKNVDLSRIYDQLGLANWAQVKAVASLNDDYGNASAHRFYAGALAGDGNRFWALNTETLLSRLLMPANINTFNSFNDYTSFFERPSLQGEYAVKAGSQHTLKQDFSAFGSLPGANLAYNAAYLPSRTAGWRADYPERRRGAYGFVKWDPAPNHGLMFSATRTDTTQGGNFSPRFAYDEPAAAQDARSSEHHNLELGYAYRPQPASLLLLHAASVRAEEGFTDYTLDRDILPGYRVDTWARLATAQPYDQIQGEIMHRRGAHQFTLGSSYYHQQGRDEFSVDREIIPPDYVYIAAPPLLLDYRQHLWSSYIHDAWRIDPTLTMELALYNEAMTRVNLYRSAARESHELSPRLGVRWQPGPAHTLHLALFRSLVPFYADTLAPSTIAGVPVQRDGSPGTTTDEADLGWDYELGTAGMVSANLFYLERRFHEPSETETAPVMHTRDRGGRVVLEYLLGEAAGMALSYRFDDIDNDLDPSLDRVDHLLRVGWRWIGQQGLTLGVSQSSRLAVLRSPTRDNESLSLTDLSLVYEFPGKHGSLTFEVNNLFDSHFNWLVDPFTAGGRAPAREAMLTLKLIY